MLFDVENVSIQDDYDYVTLKVRVRKVQFREGLRQNGISWVIKQLAAEFGYALERSPEVLH